MSGSVCCNIYIYNHLVVFPCNLTLCKHRFEASSVEAEMLGKPSSKDDPFCSKHTISLFTTTGMSFASHQQEKAYRKPFLGPRQLDFQIYLPSEVYFTLFTWDFLVLNSRHGDFHRKDSPARIRALISFAKIRSGSYKYHLTTTES